MVRYRKISDTDLVFGSNCPYIDVKYNTGSLFISSAVLKLIDNPAGIRFQWNPAKCILIIEPTTIDDPDGFPVIGATYAKTGLCLLAVKH